MTAARGGVWFSESEVLSPTHSQSSAAYRAPGSVDSPSVTGLCRVSWSCHTVADHLSWVLHCGQTHLEFLYLQNPQSPEAEYLTPPLTGVQDQEGQKGGVPRQIWMLVVAKAGGKETWRETPGFAMADCVYNPFPLSLNPPLPPLKTQPLELLLIRVDFCLGGPATPKVINNKHLSTKHAWFSNVFHLFLFKSFQQKTNPRVSQSSYTKETPNRK